MTLAVLHMRAARAGTTHADAAMWSGLAIFFAVATFASPHLGTWAVVAALALAATSVVRLVAVAGRPGDVARSPIRRRIFA